MEWWNNFFDSDYYGRTLELIPDERTEKEVDFVLSVLQLKKKAKILDLCCGTGRHALRIARCGFRVTGLDISSQHLATAEKCAAADGLGNIEFVRTDMRKIPFTNHFDAVVNLFGSFGYFMDDRENFKVIGAISKALKPGCLFLLETLNREHAVRDDGGVKWFENEEGITINEYWFDVKTDTAHGKWIWIKEGKRTDGESSVKLYPYTTYEKEFAKQGLEIIDSFGDYDASEYSLESGRIILLARKM